MTVIRSAVEKAGYVWREEGPLIFLDRIGRLACVRARRRFRDNGPTVERWSRIRGVHRGKRAFLIGNGPSLNRTPLHLLKNEYTVCFNRFNVMFERLDWIPRFYCNIDDRVLTDMVAEINGFAGRFEGVFIPDLHPYNIDFSRKIADADNLYWLFLERLEFSRNLPFCGINKTVANVGLQVLAFMGFSPIYLIGIDLDYVDHSSARKDNRRDWTSTGNDDPNHFDPRYFGAGRRYHHPRMDETLVRFREAKRFFAESGIEIVNAGVGGRLDVFPRIPFRELFRETAAGELGLFIDLLRKKLGPGAPLNPGADRLEDVFPGPERMRIGRETAPAEGRHYLLCDTETGVARIKDLVFDWLPLGPVQDQYVFIRRSLVHEPDPIH